MRRRDGDRNGLGDGKVDLLSVVEIERREASRGLDMIVDGYFESSEVSIPVILMVIDIVTVPHHLF